MSACPDKLLLVHGLADGELDAANALAVEAHLKTCADCRAELAQIEAMRELLRDDALAHRAPQALRNRIDAALDAAVTPAGAAPRRPSAPPSPRAPYALAGGAAIAAHVLNGRWASGAMVGIAASLALMVAMPQLTHTGTEDQLVQSHIRSLMVGHLTDIPTSNRHVVKPWFNGKIDFAPPVPELADEGFPLVGGRLDYIDDHAVAAIVYRRRLHTINLFVRPAGTLSLPFGETRRLDGYTLVRWTKGGLEYWAVSDLDPGELQLFKTTFVPRAVP
jgi:anti-sigma factor RsiW